MQRYIKPEILVIEVDTRAALMATSQIGWGDGDTNTMEAPGMRQRHFDWSDYER